MQQHNDEIFNLILNHAEPNEDFSGYVLSNICKYMKGEQRINRCKQLLENKWAFNASLPSGQDGLLYFLVNDKTVDFSFLLKNFREAIPVNYSDQKDFWFFKSLLRSGNKGMIQFIMDKQDDFNPTLLDINHASYITFALRFGRLDIACELLKKIQTLHRFRLNTMAHLYRSYRFLHVNQIL